MINLAMLTDIARQAIQIGQPMLPEEHTSITLRNTQPAQDVAYNPDNAWPSQSAPTEHVLSGILTRNTVMDDESGGVATAIEQQTFMAVFEDLPDTLKSSLATQQGIDDLCRMNGTWSAILSNGLTLRVKEVTIAGPMVRFVMRKTG